MKLLYSVNRRFPPICILIVLDCTGLVNDDLLSAQLQPLRSFPWSYAVEDLEPKGVDLMHPLV